MDSFYKRYLKYKNKYSKIKKQVGGGMIPVNVEVNGRVLTVSFPEAFFCQITTELFVDPVTTVDGITIERSFVEEWFETHDTSPVTGDVLKNKLLIPNRAVRNSIEDIKQDAYQKLLQQEMASAPSSSASDAFSSGMAAVPSSRPSDAFSSGMAAVPSSRPSDAFFNGMAAVPSSRPSDAFSSGMAATPSPQFLKKQIAFNLYNNIAGDVLSLKDPSVECIKTIAYKNDNNLWIIVHPSYPRQEYLKSRYYVVNIKVPKSVVDNRGMWDF
jgi:U-box domain